MHEKIVICIPTCNREKMLESLILKVIDNIKSFTSNINVDINIVVVDNSIDESSRRYVENINSEYVYYFSEKNRGYSNVRNRCLDEARNLNCKYIIFIDDDEYPANGWIESFYKKSKQGYDIIFGPVYPKFKNNKVPKWIVKNNFFIKDTEDYIKKPLLFTSNTFINLQSIKNIRFNQNFNTYGGEDVTFFNEVKRETNCVLGWCSDAIVYEIIPEERTKVRWFLKRAYNNGVSDVLTDKGNGEYVNIILKIIYNFLVGTIFLPICFLGNKYFVIKVLSKLYRSIGSMYSLLFIKYKQI